MEDEFLLGNKPMQLLITNELNKEDYFWIQNLRTDLNEKGELNEVLDAYESHRFSRLHQSVMNAIIHANSEKKKEFEKFWCYKKIGEIH